MSTDKLRILEVLYMDNKDPRELQLAAYELGQLRAVLDLFSCTNGNVQIVCTFSNSFTRIENIPLKISEDELRKCIIHRISELSKLFIDF